MGTLPIQTPPVIRLQTAGVELADTADDGATGQRAYGGGVEASQSRCDALTGPAQSMCYAALYGVRI